MKPLKRTLLGLGSGLLLWVIAFAILGVGHGPDFAWAGNGGLIYFLLPSVAFFLAPVLWALYFWGIPKLENWGVRMAAVVGVVASHIGTALYVANRGTVKPDLGFAVAYWLVLALSCFVLGGLSVSEKSSHSAVAAV